MNQSSNYLFRPDLNFSYFSFVRSFFLLRLLLQVDPRRRPRVDDLENLASLQQFIIPARTLLNEYRLNQVRNFTFLSIFSIFVFLLC
jgi:hypothetical protein